jgi:hypothetical protein
MIDKLRELHRLKSELDEQIERLRRQTEEKPNPVLRSLYARVVAECEVVQREISELTQVMLEGEHPQGTG